CAKTKVVIVFGVLGFDASRDASPTFRLVVRDKDFNFNVRIKRLVCPQVIWPWKLLSRNNFNLKLHLFLLFPDLEEFLRRVSLVRSEFFGLENVSRTLLARCKHGFIYLNANIIGLPVQCNHLCTKP